MSLNATLRLNYSKNLNIKAVPSNLVKKEEVKKPNIKSKSLRIENKTLSRIGKVNREKHVERSKDLKDSTNMTMNTTIACGNAVNNENDKNSMNCPMNMCVNLNKEFFSKKDNKANEKGEKEIAKKSFIELVEVNDDNMSGNKSKGKSNSNQNNSTNPDQNDLNVTMKSSKDDSALKEQEADKQFREQVLNKGKIPQKEVSPDKNKNSLFACDLCDTSSSSSKPVSTNNFLNKTINQVQIDISKCPSYSQNYENLLINKQNSPKFTNEEYRKMFTKLIRKEYSKSILNNLFEEEEQIDDPLMTHKITERMRVRMVDWMIEVLANYKCEDLSFFVAINIMDRFFKSSEFKNKTLQPGELHLIGVTSMFMASKYQDIYPLRLKIVHEKIAHKKLSFEDIKSKEEEISKSLSYILGKPTQWDFINHFIEEIFFTSYNSYHIKDTNLLNYYLEMNTSNLDKDKTTLFTKLYNTNMINLLRHVVIYLAKMNTHDYGLINKKPSLVAASTIYVAMKICEQINKEEYVHEYFTKRLVDASKKTENEIIKCAQKILYNAQNFDSIFTGLENLKKVHFNTIIELKNTK